jgi:hypothetical protein
MSPPRDYLWSSVPPSGAALTMDNKVVLTDQRN